MGEGVTIEELKIKYATLYDFANGLVQIRHSDGLKREFLEITADKEKILTDPLSETEVEHLRDLMYEEGAEMGDIANELLEIVDRNYYGNEPYISSEFLHATHKELRRVYDWFKDWEVKSRD